VTRSVDERTDLLLAEIAALTRAKATLEKARQAAEAANLAKTRYLVGVSHEIRSPLNAIYGYAQLLEKANVVDPAEAGRVIRSASEHLTAIVEGLLDISRIESGVQKLSRDQVDLPKFLETIVAMTRVQAESKGLELVYSLPRNLPAYVWADEKRLRQILVNLLSNAVKYTPSGTVSLTVLYRGLIAEFGIADTGIGIATGDLETIFEPFDRGSAELAQSQPGAGLGLAITRMLAQVMGGDVSVSSVVGTGSKFKLRLMLPEATNEGRAAHLPEAILGYLGKRRTVLLVDDDPAQLHALQSLLNLLGFTVYAAMNGAESLALAGQHAPDLVLLDIQLGDETGWDILRKLRALSCAVTPKILMVSANAHEFEGRGDTAGLTHDGFVPKPVRFDTLLEAIGVQLSLTWERARAVGEPGSEPPASFPALPPEPIERLRTLAQMGDRQAIENQLNAMASKNPEATTWFDLLRVHLRNFDLTAFLHVLDRNG
jgi:DNA-binding response OmpR family regulator/nitrogen-specific signal transduction histidine kinase